MTLWMDYIAVSFASINTADLRLYGFPASALHENETAVLMRMMTDHQKKRFLPSLNDDLYDPSSTVYHHCISEGKKYFLSWSFNEGRNLFFHGSFDRNCTIDINCSIDIKETQSTVTICGIYLH